jgi:carbamoyl-phosphate synthase small subunit
MQMIVRPPVKNSSKQNGNRSERGDFLIPTQASGLYLSDGKLFTGLSPAWQTGEYIGEVVFNTGMTGYVESLTDPSYSNQILVFTYPMIGNYGVQPADVESPKIQVKGVIVSQVALQGSHEKSVSSLLDWLHSQQIPVLVGVDTRALTKHLRSHGTMIGGISSKPIKVRNIKLEPVTKILQKATTYNQGGKKKIILVDCGAKDNILQSLIARDYEVKRVPSDYDYLKEKYDGIVLSNGPGDPTDYQPTIKIASKALAGDKPVLGICLGNQIIALAAGAKTYKLPFGHRGHNQPCMELSTQRCFITSQNHGYAIKEKSLPKDWQVSFRNLNDSSVEGIKHRTKPFFSVQFHPEACPGPTDTNWLFDEFAGLV